MSSEKLQALHARREALNGKRHTVTFYGGWFVIDERTGKTTPALDLTDALTLAEERNPNPVTTQTLIDRALNLIMEPMRSTLGMRCGWLSFSRHGPVEVQMSIWGPWNNPTKTMATFWCGSERISREVAEKMLESVS